MKRFFFEEYTTVYKLVVLRLLLRDINSRFHYCLTILRFQDSWTIVKAAINKQIEIKISPFGLRIGCIVIKCQAHYLQITVFLNNLSSLSRFLSWVQNPKTTTWRWSSRKIHWRDEEETYRRWLQWGCKKTEKI